MADSIAIQTQKLDQLVDMTQRRLLTVQTVFPFDLFPDRIHIDENKVEIIHREFFVEENIFPILMKNITGVVISTGLFFASLKIEVVGHSMNPTVINRLSRKDAIRAKRIIMGTVACHKENIDIFHIPIDELRTKVEEIGKAYEHTNI